MGNEEIYELLKKKVQFQGIAVRNFEQGKFCGLFDVNGTSFIIDNVVYEQDQIQHWDVNKSKIYHYTIPTDDHEDKTCPFCDYRYEIGKPISEELVCVALNEEPLLTGIWGNCLFSPTFEKTFDELKYQLNPAGIKSEKVNF